MTVLGDVLSQTQEALSAAGIPDARLEAEVFLTNLLAIPRHRLYAYPEEDVPDPKKELLAQLVERRLTREPLAYILGHKEFYGIDLIVDRGVLIPRPESEFLVEQALFLSMTHEEEVDWVIAEPGTGSGAISISLAIHLPMARIYATENSPEAIEVATKNIQLHNLSDRITLIQGNLLDDVPEPANVIVSNLPYIRSENINGLQPEVLWEPRRALDGGADGLVIIRALLDLAPGQITENGVMLLEIDSEQARSLEVHAHTLFPEATISIQQDLAHLDRYFVMELSTPA